MQRLVENVVGVMLLMFVLLVAVGITTILGPVFGLAAAYVVFSWIRRI